MPERAAGGVPQSVPVVAHMGEAARSGLADAVVEYRGVTVRFGSQTVLRDVALTIERGEILALVGRSGAGKSTLLKLANRMLLPNDGRVFVEGRDTRVWDPIALRRRTGYVLQDVGLFPHFTVEENVALVPRLEGWSESRRKARAAELLELVGLPPSDFAHRWPRELSGGQRQRVGVARALATQPPVLLMDEPFGALDPMTRAELQTEFQRIHRALVQTSILVTHDMREALRLGSRVGILEDGRLVACDRPDRLIASGDERIQPFMQSAVARPGGAANAVWTDGEG